MNWTETLKQQIEEVYHASEGLMDLLDDAKLGWKPESGDNWMTTGQLLKHMASACGMPAKGFVTGDWGMPEGVSPGDMPPEEMLPPASKLPAAASVAEAKAELASDKQLALDMVAKAGEDELANKMVKAPWNPSERLLGYQLLEMAGHLNQHKGQLFYYLKLQGNNVNTRHLWGM